MEYRKWSDLMEKKTPEERAEIKTRSAQLLAELPLEQLRAARSLTQTNMAQMLGVNQSAASKVEKRADMYLSTLRSYIEAMGGAVRNSSGVPRRCSARGKVEQ